MGSGPYLHIGSKRNIYRSRRGSVGDELSVEVKLPESSASVMSSYHEAGKRNCDTRQDKGSTDEINGYVEGNRSQHDQGKLDGNTHPEDRAEPVAGSDNRLNDGKRRSHAFNSLKLVQPGKADGEPSIDRQIRLS